MSPYRMALRAPALLSLMLTVLLLSGCSLPAPKAQLWDRWTAHDERDRRQPDTAYWALFLQRYVGLDDEGVERLRYAQVSDEDRAKLNGWIRLQQRQAVSGLSLREQRAYWLNLYNASVVALVLDHPEVSTLDALEPPLWRQWLQRRAGPFATPRFSIEGQSLSLNDIEHRILRPRWRDPRTDYALCKARLGAPALAAEPYAGEHLDEQLEARAQAWAASPHALRYNADGSIALAAFWSRYREDFGSDADVLATLQRRAAGDRAARLASVTRVRGHYDEPALNLLQ